MVVLACVVWFYVLGHSLPINHKISKSDSEVDNQCRRYISGEISLSELEGKLDDHMGIYGANNLFVQQCITEMVERQIEVDLRRIHPYGTDPNGLITQCRVELEKECRDSGRQMAILVERIRIAEQHARKRWPHAFKDAEVIGAPGKQKIKCPDCSGVGINLLDPMGLTACTRCNRHGVIYVG